MDIIKALLVDDESLARDALRIMLAEDPEIVVIGECRDGTEAVKAILEKSPDLVFLDIQMPDLDGFSVIEKIGVTKMPVVIFVTAFDQHALQAFSVHALDYILKPFNHERFNNAVRRAKKHVRDQGNSDLGNRLRELVEGLSTGTGISTSQQQSVIPPAASPRYRERLVIKGHGRVFFLKVEEIDWIEAAGDYVKLHVGKQTHLIREKIGDTARKLDPEIFLRIHRSSIVNIERIKDIQPLFKGEFVVTLDTGRQLKLSRGYREKLNTLLDEKF